MVSEIETQLSRTRKEAIVNAKASMTAAHSARAMKLATVVTTFQKWLYLPDSLPLLTVLGAVAANLMPGDPVWLLLIGPPSGGKTELLHPLTSLDRVFIASTLTEAALLSGTPRREASKDSSGGLLRMVGAFGVLLCKDFTSVLSMNRDTRASVLAALREVYDGSWTRHLGTDGGRTLHWEGKVGFIGACTSIIDQHHAVIATMGERFIMFRLPSVDGDELAARALDHQGDENRMRPELCRAVKTLFDDLDLTTPPAIDSTEKNRLIALSTLAVKCRSAVERDGHTREVELVPESEAPGRLVGALSRLLAGVTALGASRADAWRVVAKVAMDCVPALRLSTIRVLSGSCTPLKTETIATAVRYPAGTTRRALEDLTAHGVVRRAGKQGNADLWELSRWTVKKCADAGISFPEMSDADTEEVFPDMSVKETLCS